jgi:hypothetical protein
MDSNVALSDAKNCFHDFVTGSSGGVLDLVVLVRVQRTRRAEIFGKGFGIPKRTRHPIRQVRFRCENRLRNKDNVL